MDARGWAVLPIVQSPTIQISKHMEPGLTGQPSLLTKRQKGSREQPILEADLLEDLVFNDVNLEDLVFNDVKLEDFFNEERVPSSFS